MVLRMLVVKTIGNNWRHIQSRYVHSFKSVCVHKNEISNSKRVLWTRIGAHFRFPGQDLIMVVIWIPQFSYRNLQKIVHTVSILFYRPIIRNLNLELIKEVSWFQTSNVSKDGGLNSWLRQNYSASEIWDKLAVSMIRMWSLTSYDYYRLCIITLLKVCLFVCIQPRGTWSNKGCFRTRTASTLGWKGWLSAL